MCWKCGNDVDAEEPVGRGAECPVCRADLRSCRNCRFYEPGRRYGCRETVDELVRDKERANFCGSFRLRREWRGMPAGGGAAAKAEAARRAFDALFG